MATETAACRVGRKECSIGAGAAIRNEAINRAICVPVGIAVQSIKKRAGGLMGKVRPPVPSRDLRATGAEIFYPSIKDIRLFIFCASI